MTALLEEVREYLEKMAAHKDCCGVPLMRRVEAALSAPPAHAPLDRATAIKIASAFGGDGMVVCDCGNETFLVGLSIGAESNPALRENHIHSMICAKCHHLMPVPYRLGRP